MLVGGACLGERLGYGGVGAGRTGLRCQIVHERLVVGKQRLGCGECRSRGRLGGCHVSSYGAERALCSGGGG